MSVLLVRFCVFSEEGKGCRMFRASYMNNVLLYFGHSYIEGEQCNRGASERRSKLKTFVVFNPAYLVETVLGILQQGPLGKTHP